MIYGHDYYERGIETGLSNYQNYRWIPELTIPLAMTIIDYLQIKPGEPILDFGCAKAYLVKALRLLHRDAYGYDVSEYALANVDVEVKPFITNAIFSNTFKYCLCKDVLEHISLTDLKILLQDLNVEKLFTVVPLGCDGKYNASINNLDITHIHCESEEWWLNLFAKCGWTCLTYSFRIKGIKDSYVEIHPKSHLFMVHIR